MTDEVPADAWIEGYVALPTGDGEMTTVDALICPRCKSSYAPEVIDKDAKCAVCGFQEADQ